MYSVIFRCVIYIVLYIYLVWQEWLQKSVEIFSELNKNFNLLHMGLITDIFATSIFIDKLIQKSCPNILCPHDPSEPIKNIYSTGQITS